MHGIAVPAGRKLANDDSAAICGVRSLELSTTMISAPGAIRRMSVTTLRTAFSSSSVSITTEIDFKRSSVDCFIRPSIDSASCQPRL